MAAGVSVMIIKNSIQATLSRLQIIPVITIDNPQHAAPLAETLLNAGLHCAEITFRTEAAVETLRTFASFGQFTLGAGTVIDKEQLKAAIEAGADFIVSPGFDPALVAECLENKVQFIPGCCTPSEIQQAIKNSLSLIKFFPAEAFGGVSALKALSAPYPNVSFIPTGGITVDNVATYLKLDCVTACGMTEIVNRDLIATSDFDTIFKLTKEILDKR
jgi:2-dehydro-3-deoxyphosphogluconate aldolase/(4S)-4-hydroxy-2-oxoglutarate aldolase